MTVRIVRLGTPRARGEGLRIGTVRRPPRGVPKSEFAKRDYYDLWYPNVAPSLALMNFARSKPLEGAHFQAFAKQYLAEMAAPEASHDLDLLAALSRTTDFAVGCYCEEESRCHRSLLRKLLGARGADLAD